jgi:hypothetical protein
VQKQKEADAGALPKFPTAAQGSEGTDQRAKLTYSADLGTAQHLDFGNHSLPCYNIRADRTWQMQRLSHLNYFSNSPPKYSVGLVIFVLNVLKLVAAQW